MHRSKLLVLSAIVVASAFIGLLSSTDTIHASGNFAPYYKTTPTDLSAGGIGNTTTNFGFDIGVPFGTGDMNFAASVAFIAPDFSITPGSSIPVGEIIGQTLVAPTVLGILNGTCSTGIPVGFTFRSASTDVRDTINPMPEGTFNRIGNLRQDVRGATPGSAPDGIPDHLNAYPAFLNKVFDPDDSDVSGSSPVYPLRPLARYSATTNVAGTDVLLQFLVFGPGALTQFANTGLFHPSQQFTEDFGYPSVTVLQDPTASAAPSTITDFCAPLKSITNLSGTTNPEVSNIFNQCGNAIDEDADGGDGAGPLGTNDGCPRIGIAESGVECDNIVDDAEDFPPDGAINDGCVTIGSPELPALPIAQCAGSADDDSDGAINDGCPAVGFGEEDPANPCPGGSTADCGSGGGDSCANGIDDDFDFEVNDGCPTVGPSTVNVNPLAGTGLYGTNTHLTLQFNMSLRNADGDPYENFFDTCPFVVNADNPRLTIGDDEIGPTLAGDNIDDACDAAPGPGPGTQCGPGTTDDTNGSLSPNVGLAGFDCDLDNFFNAQDNCPQIANPGQVESESNVPYDIAAPDGGSRTDQIGDACDTSPTVADGHYHVQFNVAATCYAPGADADGDGWCDGTEENTSDSTFLGSDAGVGGGQLSGEAGFIVGPTGIITDLCANSTDDDGDGDTDAADAGCSTPEHVGVDYQFPISNPGATRIAAGSSAESGLQCVTSTSGVGVDDDADGVVNDGCPTDGTPESGADCLNAIDDDDGGSGPANEGCPIVGNGVAQTCSDGLDNDQDGLIDQLDPGCAASITPDVDADGVCNSGAAVAGKCILVSGNGAGGVDNCPTQSNPNQSNTDFDLNAAGATVAHGSGTFFALPADSLGNACDDDDDNDSWTGNSQVDINGLSSGVCRTSAPDAPIFRDCIENYLGTDPLDNCPGVASDDAWPVDINRTPASIGQVNTLDTGAGGFIPLQTAQNLRADFNADLSVNLFDFFLLSNNGALSDSYGTKKCT